MRELHGRTGRFAAYFASFNALIEQPRLYPGGFCITFS